MIGTRSFPCVAGTLAIGLKLLGFLLHLCIFDVLHSENHIFYTSILLLVQRKRGHYDLLVQSYHES